ncbi:UNVERIFIED_CONTAM: hypothetical protein H355_014894 [Colinus virginianus]|nr:hypothetical protein H355_014894 [Colinus virginianus]
MNTLVQEPQPLVVLLHFSVSGSTVWLSALTTRGPALQVQRKALYLDGIFTESSDIRLQLPEEAKKFDGVQRQFVSLMTRTYQNPNILSVCCAENRLQLLKGLSAELDRCQKSLADYLDTKRCAFPR